MCLNEDKGRRDEKIRKIKQKSFSFSFSLTFAFREYQTSYMRNSYDNHPDTVHKSCDAESTAAAILSHRRSPVFCFCLHIYVLFKLNNSDPKNHNDSCRMVLSIVQVFSHTTSEPGNINHTLGEKVKKKISKGGERGGFFMNKYNKLNLKERE